LFANKRKINEKKYTQTQFFKSFIFGEKKNLMQFNAIAEYLFEKSLRKAVISIWFLKKCLFKNYSISYI
jgi:hypothetical protein